MLSFKNGSNAIVHTYSCGGNENPPDIENDAMNHEFQVHFDFTSSDCPKYSAATILFCELTNNSTFRITVTQYDEIYADEEIDFYVKRTSVSNLITASLTVVNNPHSSVLEIAKKVPIELRNVKKNIFELSVPYDTSSITIELSKRENEGKEGVVTISIEEID